MNFWGASSTTHLEWVSIGMMGVFFFLDPISQHMAGINGILRSPAKTYLVFKIGNDKLVGGFIFFNFPQYMG